MGDDMATGAGGGLVAFLTWAGERGVMAPNTANSHRVAVQKILEVEANPEGVDITKLDVEDLLDRFGRLRGSNYSPGSMATYKTRFRNSVREYVRYLDDPGAYRGPTSIKPRGSRAGSAAPSIERPASSSRPTSRPATASSQVDERIPAPPSSDALVQYPFPLRSGGTAYLHLPRQLGREDVDRLAQFLNSLVIETADS